MRLDFGWVIADEVINEPGAFFDARPSRLRPGLVVGPSGKKDCTPDIGLTDLCQDLGKMGADMLGVENHSEIGLQAVGK